MLLGVAFFVFYNRTECPERAGMALATVVETLENIPEGVRPFYKEVDGKFILDADVESHPQVQGLRNAYRSEHEKRKSLDSEKAKFSGVDLDRWERLKDFKDEDFALIDALRNDSHKSGTNGSTTASTLDLEAEIEKRMRPVKTAHQAEIEKREQMLRALEAEREQVKTEMKRTRIETALTTACAEAGVLPSAVEDVVYLGQRYFKVNDAGEVIAVDSSGVELFGADGKPMRPREWISTRGTEKAHWFPLNAGGGAGGGRFNGETRVTRKSELKDTAAKVAFVKKYGGNAYIALPD
jgi:hypothetical protein